MRGKLLKPKSFIKGMIVLLCVPVLNVFQLLTPLEVAAQPINAPYNGDLGVNLINYGDSAEGFREMESGTVVNAVLASQRIQKAKDVGMTWERINFAWNNIERYNTYLSTIPNGNLADAYPGEEDANPDTENPNNDLVDNGDGKYYRKWEGREDACDSDFVNAELLKSPLETTWTYGTNDNIVPSAGIPLNQLQNEASGLRQYTDQVELNASQGINMLGILNTAARCRSLVGSSNVPVGLNHSIFIGDTDSVPSGGITESNLNPANPWAFFVYRTVSRYGQYINSWQIWNEMNEEEFWKVPGLDAVQRAQLYGRLAEIAKVIIENIDPGSNIVMGGLVYDTQGGVDNWYTGGCSFNDISACNTPTVNFVRALVTETSSIYGTPIKDLFNTYALHRYCVPWAAFNFLRWVQSDMQFGAANSWWLTELGNCDGVLSTDPSNAEFASQLIPYLLANKSNYNIGKFFIFHMGSLVDKNLNQEYPMYDAFQTMYEYLRDANFDSMQYYPDDRSTVDGLYLTGTSFSRVFDLYQSIRFYSPRYDRVSVLWSLQDYPHTVQIDRSQNGRHALFVRYDNSSIPFGIIDDLGNVRYSFDVEGGEGTGGSLSGPIFLVEDTGCTQPTPTGTLCAQFFNSTNLQGTLIWEEEVTLTGQSLSFNWGEGSPIANEYVFTNYFSVRFSGNVDLPIGAYDFAAGSDDGIRVYLDNQQVDFGANTWTEHGYREYDSRTPINVTSGGPYPLVVEYFESGGEARFDVEWTLNASACAPNDGGGISAMSAMGEEFETMDAVCPRLPFLDEFQVNYYNNVTNGNIDFDGRIPTYTDFLNTDQNNFYKINYNWGTARPVPDPTRPNLINANNFAVRFWGTFEFQTGGDYIFRATSDNGVRIKLKLDVGGGQILTVPILTDWTAHSTRTTSAVVSLPPGEHRIIVEYYDNSGTAVVQVGWEPAANTVCQTPNDGTFCAKYYNNVNMTGAPVLNRIETLTRTEHPNIGIDYSWGTASPGTGVNVNNFSAVWEGYINFDTTDIYRFITNSDNGMRLFVDNALIVDDWTAHNPARVASAYRNMTAGLHLIRVEYYETTGNATAQFFWESMSYLISTNYECTTQVNAFCTKFYNTNNFEGNPRIVPNHAMVLQPSTFTEPGRAGYMRNWGTASAVPGRVNANNWTAVFEGKFEFAEAGEYEFTSQSDDGMKIFVNGQLVVDNWGTHTLNTVSDTWFLAPGTYTVRVVYYDVTGVATSNFWWEKVGDYSGGTTYPYGIIRADTDPVTILGNQNFQAIKNIPKLFDGIYEWPNNAVVHYVNHTPISVLMEFNTPVTLNGFKISAAAERWDVYKADSWEDMEAGQYTVVATNLTGTPVDGYVNINFTASTAKVFKIKFTRTSGDGIVHILDIVPKFGTTSPNSGPSMSFIPNQVIHVGERWIYRPYVSDPNDGPSFLYFNLGANPEGIYYASTANLQGLGYLEWLPWFTHIGTHQIFVTVRDTEGNTATRSFFITVLP